MYLSSRDWSSDVCSSDLPKTPKPHIEAALDKLNK